MDEGLAALLIDVDNFHDADQLVAAHEQFTRRVGKTFICHIHGDERLLHQEKLKPVWQRLSARRFPCLPLCKNTTDVALAVDALTLHFKSGVTHFGIASGDADFAPLSLQLRELGCEVMCFAREAVAFDAIVSYYNDVVRFAVPPPPPAKPIDVHKQGDVKVNKSPVLPEAGTPERPARVPESRLVMPLGSGEPSAEETAAVRPILNAFADWRPHTLRQLNQLGGPLRQGGLAKGNAPLYKLFRKYPHYFTVLPPDGAPQKVRLERRP